MRSIPVSAPVSLPDTPVVHDATVGNTTDQVMAAGPESRPGYCVALPTPLWKRAIDVAFAGTALLFLSPVLLVVAVMTKVTMGGPVLFTQDRGGHGGTVFRLIKFRSMLDLRDEDGKLLPDAERTHWWGSIVRRLSLDELPSLLNVLRGEMSLVGPRPFLADYLPRYTPEQARRHAVVPGITGPAQTRGRNVLSWERKFQFDLEYVDHRSFRYDLSILWDTLRVVVSGDGADGVEHATEFLGTDETEGEQITLEFELDFGPDTDFEGDGGFHTTIEFEPVEVPTDQADADHAA
ncbi:MAG: sugar transferase [Actinomycetota bacterium]